MKKQKIWIVIADAAIARVYEKDEAGKFVAIDHVLRAAKEEGYEQGRSEALGKTQESAASAHHIIEPRQDEKTAQMLHFSRVIAEFLESSLTQGRYGRLILAASPKMLGHLRDTLPKAVRDAIQMELDKDYTHLKADEIHDQLKKVVNI